MECVCTKQKEIDELYERTNSHNGRLITVEVKLQMILWALALVIGLLVANLIATIARNQERTTEMYNHYQSIEKGKNKGE